MRASVKTAKDDSLGTSILPFPSQDNLAAPTFDEVNQASHSSYPTSTKNSDDVRATAADARNREEEDSWRKPGRQFRSNLMRLDAKNAFQLKPECSIERYYQVADRVRIHLHMLLVSNSSGHLAYTGRRWVANSDHIRLWNSSCIIQSTTGMRS
jgi:hypothetical protein